MSLIQLNTLTNQIAFNAWVLANLISYEPSFCNTIRCLKDNIGEGSDYYALLGDGKMKASRFI